MDVQSRILLKTVFLTSTKKSILNTSGTCHVKIPVILSLGSISIFQPP